MREESDKTTAPTEALTAQEFAHLGDGALAYVKTIASEDVARLFPQAPPHPAGREAVRPAWRRRLADHADRFEGRGDRQRLGARARDGQPALREQPRPALPGAGRIG